MTTQKPLSELTIVEAADKLEDWNNGRSGSFVTGLFNLMGYADPQNFERLRVAFLSLTRIYELWRDGDGTVRTCSPTQPTLEVQ
jgi:hypothetical protein